MINKTLLRQLADCWLACRWHSPQDLSLPEPLNGWLTETGSMTARFEQCSAEIVVLPLFEGFVRPEQVPAEAERLPDSKQYWLREIVLYGAGQPWLWARTVIPQQTLTEQDRQIMTLNNTPLGHYLFRSGRLTRDYLLIAQCDNLWGRCSRLRLADKPLLLTEVFLPASPLY
jgi:chorismate--pyruvate lyase